MTATKRDLSTPLRGGGDHQIMSKDALVTPIIHEKQRVYDSLPRYEFRSLKRGDILGQGSRNYVYELTRPPSSRNTSPFPMRSILNNFYNDNSSSSNSSSSSSSMLVVKTLKPKLLHHQEAIDDLVHEGNTLAELQGHENIVRIHNRMDDDLSRQKRPFVIMDRVEESLSDRIQRWKKIPINNNNPNTLLQKQLMVAIGVAKGLVWVHRNGVVHCDVKPANIGFHHEDGTVKLLDFGSARYQSTYQEMIRGTIAYMAPEAVLLMGKRQHFVTDEVLVVDEKLDVHAFGVMLWELFSLHKPVVFHGYHSKLLRLIERNHDINKKIMPPHVWMDKKHWPEALCRLMEQCWSFEPWKRPTMQQALQTLQDIISKDMNNSNNNSNNDCLSTTTNRRRNKEENCMC